jgi:hypothetical protein
MRFVEIPRVSHLNGGGQRLFGTKYQRESMLLNVRFCVAVLLTCMASAVPMNAQGSDTWSEPFRAHRVIGNVYYVGSTGLAAYLIATPEGHILINSNLESSPALIQQSVERLGFRYSDIKKYCSSATPIGTTTPGAHS